MTATWSELMYGDPNTKLAVKVMVSWTFLTGETGIVQKRLQGRI